MSDENEEITGVLEEVTSETSGLVAERLSGSVTSFIVDRLRHLPKPYAMMSESEQQDIIEDAVTAGNAFVRDVVKLIAANGRPTISAIVEKVEFKDGMKAHLKMSKFCELRHALADAQGQNVLIVVADPDSYIGGDNPTPDPDQPGLPGTDDDGPIFDNTPNGQDVAAE